MRRPTVFIRADAGPLIGWGHVVRCGALADELARRGVRILWLLRDSDAAARASLGKRFELRVPDREIVQGPRVDLPKDFQTGDWIVVDRYGWGFREQRALRKSGARLLWLEDSGRGSFAAELVLNQNLGVVRARCRLSPGSRLLGGPRFALLRRDFVTPAPRRREFPLRARRVLVSFGGADPLGMAPRICRLLDGLDVTCVAGPSSRTGNFPAGVRLLRSVSASKMRRHMERCDLAVVSASSICWELARLGVPMAVLGVAANQEPLRRALREAGLARDLGRATTFREAVVKASLFDIIGDPGARRRMSLALRRRVDGRGVERVLRAMGVT